MNSKSSEITATETGNNIFGISETSFKVKWADFEGAKLSIDEKQRYVDLFEALEFTVSYINGNLGNFSLEMKKQVVYLAEKVLNADVLPDVFIPVIKSIFYRKPNTVVSKVVRLAAKADYVLYKLKFHFASKHSKAKVISNNTANATHSSVKSAEFREKFLAVKYKTSVHNSTENNVFKVEEKYNVNGFATKTAKTFYFVFCDDKIHVTDCLEEKNHYECYNAANLSIEEKICHHELIDELSNLKFHIRNDERIDPLLKERNLKMIPYFVGALISPDTFIFMLKRIVPNMLDRLLFLIENGFPVLEKIRNVEDRRLANMKLNNVSVPEDEDLCERLKSQIINVRGNKVLTKFYWTDKCQKSFKADPNNYKLVNILLKNLLADRIDMNHFLEQMEALSGYRATTEEVNHLANMIERKKYRINKKYNKYIHVATGPGTRSGKKRLQMKRKQEDFQPEVQSKMIKLDANILKSGDNNMVKPGTSRTARVGHNEASVTDFNVRAELEKIRNEGLNVLKWIIKLSFKVGRDTENPLVPIDVFLIVGELIQCRLRFGRFLLKLRPILRSAKFDRMQSEFAPVLNAFQDMKRRDNFKYIKYLTRQ